MDAWVFVFSGNLFFMMFLNGVSLKLFIIYYSISVPCILLNYNNIIGGSSSCHSLNLNVCLLSYQQQNCTGLDISLSAILR